MEEKIVSFSAKPKNKLNPLKWGKKQKLSLLIGTVVVAGLASWLIYMQLNKTDTQAIDPNPVVAEVAGEKLRLDDYKAWVYAANKTGTMQTPSFINEEAEKGPLLDSLAELKILDKFFAEQNVSIPQEEIAAAATEYAGELYTNGDEATKSVFEDFARLSLEQDKFNQTMLGWKKGYSLLCKYDRARQEDYDLATTEAQDLLARQEPYALEYCTNLKARLEAGADVFSEIAALEADPLLGGEIWRPNNISFAFAFDKDSYYEIGVGFPNCYDLRDRVSALEDSVGKYHLINTNDNTGDEPYAATWAVVYVESENEGVVGETYLSWLDGQKIALQVTTYIDRISL
jgi:hypothetical protein